MIIFWSTYSEALKFQKTAAGFFRTKSNKLVYYRHYTFSCSEMCWFETNCQKFLIDRAHWRQTNYYVTKMREHGFQCFHFQKLNKNINGPKDFFSLFYITIFTYFFKYETIETNVPAFLSHNNSSVATVTACMNIKAHTHPFLVCK